MMKTSRAVRTFLAGVTFLGCSTGGFAPPATARPSAHHPTGGVQREEKQKGVVRGLPVLWEEPGNIETLDLFNGPGGPDGAPDLSGELTFVKELSGGTSRKIIVADKTGRTWVVKFGLEAKPETVATRFVWAMGYPTDIAYFVKEARVTGEKSLDVKEARFERRPDGYEEVGTWSWQGNVFSEKREMEGLKLLMALLNNWDLKQVNNSIICPKKVADITESKCYYYVSDLGATFGSTGNMARKFFLPFDPPAGSKGQPDAYADQQFIEGVRNGQVVFHYKGKNPAALHGVSLETARWMGGMLSRLSEKQLSDAFRAGGYVGPENSIYVSALRSRISRLQQVSGNQITVRGRD